jgi:hypothetical protein
MSNPLSGTSEQPIYVHDWYLYSTDAPQENNHFPMPENDNIHLCGNPTHHPMFGCRKIRTSEIVKFNYEERRVVTKSGTHYQLCHVDPVFNGWMYRNDIIASDYNINSGNNNQQGDSHDQHR